MNLFLIAGTAALVSLAQSPEPPLDLSGVNNVIRSEAARRPVDQFEALSPSAWIGRRVRIEIPVVASGRTPAGNAVSWSYSAGEQALTLRAEPDEFLRLRPKAHPLGTRLGVAGFRTMRRQDSRGVEPMVNGYGAELDVEIIHETVWGIAAIAEGRTIRPKDFVTVLSLPGPEARDLAPHILLAVEGTVEEYADNQAILCGSQYVEPSMNGPREIFTDVCLLSVDGLKMSFVDGRTGGVLAAHSE